MLGRIVEIADDHRHLSVYRGFMIVEDTLQERNSQSRELGRIPLDDIAATIVHANGITYTNNLLVALATQGAPFVLCSTNHNTVGMLWPVDGNYQQGKRFDAQIAATKPTVKRMWSCIVKAKIKQQAAVLDAAGITPAPIMALAKQVRPGDPDNKEAQAAQKYWGLLFGKSFRRDQNADGLNAVLNYGYTVLRAATARAVIAAGLHPTIGIHHCNEGNPMRLVDDLMEPFRPLIDYKVWQLSQNPAFPVGVTPETKRALVKTLYADMQTCNGATPVNICLQRLAVSLAQVYMGEREQLDLPFTELPLDLMNL